MKSTEAYSAKQAILLANVCYCVQIRVYHANQQTAAELAHQELYRQEWLDRCRVSSLIGVPTKCSQSEFTQRLFLDDQQPVQFLVGVFETR